MLRKMHIRIFADFWTMIITTKWILMKYWYDIESIQYIFRNGDKSTIGNLFFLHFPRFYSPCIYKNKAGIHLYITAIRYYCVLSPETIRYDIDQFWQCDIDPWDRRQCNANIPPRSGGADPRRRFNGSGSDRHDKPDPQPTLKIIWIRIGLKITANHGCLKKMVFH